MGATAKPESFTGLRMGATFRCAHCAEACALATPSLAMGLMVPEPQSEHCRDSRAYAVDR
jgi:hypothetical protein